MVASEHEEILRVLNLVGKEQANALDGLFSPVNVVTQEQVVCVSRESSVFEKFDEIRELSMNIATYLDRCFQF